MNVSTTKIAKQHGHKASENKPAQKQAVLLNEEAGRIWDEYKYRHQHCWSTVFKLTSAAVLLGVVPYVETRLSGLFRYWLISTPLLAIALVVFGRLRMRRELFLLDQVKSRYRDHQKQLYGWHNEPQTNGFTRDVRIYLTILLVLAVVNSFVASIYLLR